MKNLFLTACWLLPLFSVAQDCDCTSDLAWVQKTFEENDAGFSYAVELKGEDLYRQHTAASLKDAQAAETPAACAAVINEWLLFFRKGHIGLQVLAGDSEPEAESESSKAAIRARFADWERVDINPRKFEKEAKSLQDPGYEGVWENGIYKIGIQRQGDEYVGVILSADNVYWMPGQVKLRITPQGATYYMRDHSAEAFDEARLIGNNFLEMGFITLERIHPKLPDTPIELQYKKAIEAEAPYFEQIDPQTALLRIPSFSNSARSKIKKVVDAHREALLATPNLILDLRNNGGGSDASYEPLLPFLYTNPIRTIGVEFLSTPLNNQRMQDFVSNPEYDFTEEERAWAQAAYDTLNQHIGEFVSVNDEPISIATYDTIYPFPARIGILIHEENGSTTEQFLLAAKQSQKVKLFGRTTSGVLDISNMNMAQSPCGEYGLYYSLSRSKRIPGMAIDGKGLQPDYYLDESIPSYQWIEFTRKVLSGE